MPGNRLRASCAIVAALRSRGVARRRRHDPGSQMPTTCSRASRDRGERREPNCAAAASRPRTSRAGRGPARPRSTTRSRAGSARRRRNLSCRAPKASATAGGRQRRERCRRPRTPPTPTRRPSRSSRSRPMDDDRGAGRRRPVEDADRSRTNRLARRHARSRSRPPAASGRQRRLDRREAGVAAGEHGDLRPLRARRPARLGRHVDGLPGDRPRARAHGRGQGARRAPLRRRQVRRPLSPRGARRREADPPEHRPGLRHRGRPWPPLHRHGVRRGQVGRPAPANERQPRP